MRIASVNAFLLTLAATLVLGCEQRVEEPAATAPKDQLAFLRGSAPRSLADRLQLERALKGNQEALYSVIYDAAKAAETKAAALAYLEQQATSGNWRASKALYELAANSTDAAIKARRLEALKSTLQAAADAGDPGALVLRGVYFHEGKFGPKEPQRACVLWNEAAAKEDPEGTHLAARCAQGSMKLSLSPPDEAIRLYERAAAKGSVSAARDLVEIYRARKDEASVRRAVGYMLETDDPKQAFWLSRTSSQQLCDLGAKRACHKNAEFAAAMTKQDAGYCRPCSRQSIEDAVVLLKRAADLGDGQAAMWLAEHYRDEDGAVELRYMQWLQKAAELEDASAMREMGKIAAQGANGVPLDSAVANNWLKKAAIRGDAEAQWRLGTRLADGVGAPRDLVAAYAWLNIAASDQFLDAGDQARAARALVSQRMTHDQVAKAQALSSTWKKGSDIVSEGATDPAKRSSSGTFFYVSSDGKAITNAHVVDGCRELRVPALAGSTARLLANDAANDLALLQVSGAPAVRARLARDPSDIKQGQDVLVYGYPLNDVLAKSGNMTQGIVSATSGLSGSSTQIQITAPIQPGSSGSPVLDDRGSIVGVVSYKLNDVAVVSATGSVPQGVGFAVSGLVLRSFLDSQRVDYERAPVWAILKRSRTDVAEAARSWTGVIECLR